MNKLHVRKDDMVVILSGKDKGKKGKVLEVSRGEGKVIVEGVNIVTKKIGNISHKSVRAAINRALQIQLAS